MKKAWPPLRKSARHASAAAERGRDDTASPPALAARHLSDGVAGASPPPADGEDADHANYRRYTARVTAEPTVMIEDAKQRAKPIRRKSAALF